MRGEIPFDLNFVNDIVRWLEEMKKGKKGAPYKYTTSLFNGEKSSAYFWSAMNPSSLSLLVV